MPNEPFKIYNITNFSVSEKIGVRKVSFIISVVASIVGGLILGYLFALKKYFNVLRHFGSSRKIWKPFFQNNTAVIITGRKGKFPRSPVTKIISERIAIPFSYNEKGNLVSKNTEYGTVLNTNEQIVEDFALIVKCNNPYNDEKKIMVLAGNHGCATEAAVHFVVSKVGIANIGERLNSSDFFAIIKIEVDNNIPKRIELLKCWKFAEVIK
jgi:hypothetical protein